jgi:hypothetical protein
MLTGGGEKQGCEEIIMDRLRAVKRILQEAPGRKVTGRELIEKLEEYANTRMTKGSRYWLIWNCTTNNEKRRKRAPGFYEKYGYNLLFREKEKEGGQWVYRAYDVKKDPEPYPR